MMKFTILALFVVAAVACVSASDAGHFIPKAFFTIDENGHKSNIRPVSPHTAHYLRRLRRQTVTSSSSSSSVQSGDGPVFFTSHQSVQHHNPEPDFSSRFGESSSTNQGTNYGTNYGTSQSGPHGVVIQTHGVIDNAGKVTYQKAEKHF